MEQIKTSEKLVLLGIIDFALKTKRVSQYTNTTINAIPIGTVPTEIN